MESIEIVKSLSKSIQAICSDGALYFSGDESIATPARKKLLLESIKILEDKIELLKKNI